MSRGLGKLQREILVTLDDARHEMADGHFFGSGHWGRKDEPGWAAIGRRGVNVRLALNVYDLRASLEYLRRRRISDRYGKAVAAFQAAFSRAVAGLVDRGLLAVLRMVPVTEVNVSGNDVEPDHELSDGRYMNVSERQRRFVRLTPAGEAIHGSLWTATHPSKRRSISTNAT